jgi:hypothetical protein
VWNRFRASEGTCQTGEVAVDVPEDTDNGRSAWDQPTRQPAEDDEEWRERILDLLENHSFLRDDEEDRTGTHNSGNRNRQE